MNTIWIIIAVVTLPILWLIYAYNRLVTLRMRAKEAISDIDVQLKRRYDLIPNLVETVKGYMTHEKSVLENVTAARSKVSQNGDAVHRAHDENALSGTLKTLFAVAEGYPDLKANTNFIELQRELTDTENKVQASRRFYNTTVRDLNTIIETFPTNLVAGTFGFAAMDFFEVDGSEKEVVQVKF
jgi:LemA protein